MSSNDESNLKAGHPPAVKAGGMRITQHKTPREEPGISEDITQGRKGKKEEKERALNDKRKRQLRLVSQQSA